MYYGSLCYQQGNTIHTIQYIIYETVETLLQTIEILNNHLSYSRKFKIFHRMYHMTSFAIAQSEQRPNAIFTNSHFL
jgi:hypothetical protein